MTADASLATTDRPNAHPAPAAPIAAGGFAGAEPTLIDALNNRLAGALSLRASAASWDDAATRAPAWITFDALRAAPLLADGAVPALTDPQGQPDIAAAAVALAAIEPLIAAIELVTGRPLLPTNVAPAPDAPAAVILVEALAEGRPVHRLLLAGDLSAVGPAGVLPIDPAAIAGIAPDWTARIAGPALRRERLAEIGVGDLYLLGAGRPVARFAPPGRVGTFSCVLDIPAGNMVVEQVVESDGSGDPPQPGGDAGPDVAISVAFPGGGLTYEKLAALVPGDIVAVSGAAGGALPVRLHADGRAVADGELIAVGEGCGVLITGLTPDPSTVTEA